ncbi:hypothetical protein ACHWQZ_G001454 [Mnemiopsis leidyi]
MTDKKTVQEGCSPPPYTPGLDLPAYHELPEKKVELPPYQEGGYGYQDAGYFNDGPRSFEILNRADMIMSVESLGSDSVFILCFLVCFLFNWVGYVVCCCLFTSVAARCGAISGIGLNLVKMLIIIKRCSFVNPQMVAAREYLEIHEFQYIGLMAIGIITMLFGVLRYNSAKRSLNRRLLLPPYDM